MKRYFYTDDRPGYRECTPQVEALEGLLCVCARILVVHGQPTDPALLAILQRIADRPSPAETTVEQIQDWAEALEPTPAPVGERVKGLGRLHRRKP